MKAVRWSYVTKAVRQFAYGAATVAIPVWLVRRGFSPLEAGLLIALALISGAAQSWMTGRLAGWFSTRTIALAATMGMAIGAALLLSHNAFLLPLAAIFGGMNIGGQEVGPFTAIEQVAIKGGAGDAHRFAWYNAVGTIGMALGSIVGGVVTIRAATALYITAAVILCALYAISLPKGRMHGERYPAAIVRRKFGIAERLSALFAVDAFAGGFVTQGFIVYWLTWRYHPSTHLLGEVLAATNVLAALSLFVAARLATRIGLLRTMVFTHLPSNILLALVPVAPSFQLAALLLLARSALSQMDVPTRQALVLRSVPEADRMHAVGVTNAVRPAAAALSPTLSGIAMQTLASGAPFFMAAILKSAYDVSLLLLYPRIAGKQSIPVQEDGRPA